jgi:hypothetical protein
MIIKVTDKSRSQKVKVRVVGVLVGQIIGITDSLRFIHNLDRALLKGRRIHYIGGGNE